jgi:hypothetical protein
VVLVQSSESLTGREHAGQTTSLCSAHRGWVAGLNHVSLIQHQNRVVVDDCAQSMCNREDGTIPEDVPDHGLYARVGLHVHRGGCKHSMVQQAIYVSAT